MGESPFKRHEPLYLKYRPQSLSELVGQEGVKRTLLNAIDHNRLTHAYLFTGPRGTGKTSTARILAKSLNCKKEGRPTAEPCQTCSCCVEITRGSSPAVFEIDAASNNSVDDARVLIERAPLKAVGGDFKVYIIDECHMLTKEAFNALLKTIEQPPEGVVFILATTEEHKVLPTIVSRCQRLMFKLINQNDLCNHLTRVASQEEIEIETEAIQLIARRSGGGLRDALSNLDQASLLSSPGNKASVSDLLRLLGALHEDVLLSISKQIAARDGQAVIDSVNQLLAEGREPQVVLQELSMHFLSLMKASYLKDPDSLASVVLGSESYIEELAAQASLFERSELSQIVEMLDRLEQTTRRSSQPAMHLEIGLLSICHRHDIYLLKDLLSRIEQLEERLAGGLDLPTASSHQSRPSFQQSHAQSIAVPSQKVAPRPVLPQLESPRPQEEKTPEQRIPEERSSQLDSAGEAHDLNSPAKHDIKETASAEAAANGGADLSELSNDIEYLWQQVLDELQRRHLPTFSLASTHAFPVAVSSSEFTIGVMKENFQKMLESKVDHIRTAFKAVSSLDLNIKIRVSENTPPAKKAVANRTTMSSSRDSEEEVSPQSPRHERSELPQEEKRPDSQEQRANDEVDSTMVKEAYKLFEGPGSRRLT